MLPRWLRVGEAVDFVAGVHPRFVARKCEAFLARTKIKHTQRVRELSKGMIVQLHLALVMAIDAKLLVLDEPTLGLDILYRKEFYESLLNDYFDHEKTILVTTHQVEEIERILTDLMFIQRRQASCSTRAWRRSATATPKSWSRRDKADAARALKPLSEAPDLRQVGIPVRRRRPRAHLATLGELHKPSVADLFVATMKGTYA